MATEVGTVAARVEMDMHEHIHKENNVFVKASLAERRLREQ